MQLGSGFQTSGRATQSPSAPLTWLVCCAAEADAAPELSPTAVVQCDGPFRHEQRWRGAGMAAPVFALRTRRSVGVGEFADIKQLVSLCSAVGALDARV